MSMIQRFGAIIKATQGTIAKATRAAKHAGRDNHQAFGLTKDMTGILNFYFPGIDFDNLHRLTPDDMAHLRDVVEGFKWFEENLKEIEALMKEYIRQQVSFNDFKARLVKDAFKGAEKIEKSVLDLFLAHKGYTSNRQILAKKSDNAVALLEKNVANAFHLEDEGLQISFQIAAANQARKLQELALKPSENEFRQQFAANQRSQKQAIKDKIKFGTGGNPADSYRAQSSNSGNGGFFQGVVNFFNGK
jgi:hypothetical protein